MTTVEALSERVEALQTEVAALRSQLARCEKVKKTLMDRVERSLRHVDGSFTVFERNILLEEHVAKRTGELAEANERLKESRETFVKAFDTSPNAISITRAQDGTFVDVNDAFVSMMGITREEALATTWEGLGLWVDDDRRRQVERAVCAGETVTGREYEFRRGNGEIAIGLLSAQAIRVCGEPCILSNISDISARKRAEEALRASQRQLSDIIEFLPDATLAIDREGRVIIWNRAIEQMTGVSAANMIGKGDHVYTIPFYGEARPQLMELVFEDRESVAARYPGITRAGDTIEAEVSCGALYNNTGGWVFAKAAPLHDPAGNVVGCIEVIRDITQRKQADDALRESEARYRSILDASPDDVTITDLEGRIAMVSPSGLAMFGYEREPELLGKSVTEIIADEDAERFSSSVALMLQGTAQGPGEYLGLRRDGSTFEIESNGQILRGAEGQATGMVFVVRDIAERKRAQEDRVRLEDQLRQAQKMESVGRLAGGVAHDFNNMLAVILTNTEMAIDQVDPDLPLRADLDEIRRAARRAADLTRQLLAFARRQTITPRVLDPNEAIEGVLRMLRRIIGEDIRFVWRPGPGLWSVKVDPSQVDQVLANLCVNARDAIAGVGNVLIETQNVHLDDDACSRGVGCVAGDYVRLAVTDDGCGMDGETLAHIFEPFFTTKAIGKGTGLGLAMVYGIARQNGGFIDVVSEPGRGSTFALYLPRHVGAADPMRSRMPPNPVACGNETILLVEDEVALLQAMTKMLEEQGYSVLAASTPGEATRLAEEHRGEIRLLVTDVIMPEMNGLDLARTLELTYPGLKRMFMSGHTADVLGQDGMLDQGVYFLHKPFERADLATKVREALDGGQ
jgi:PAS domain S-box-containing protein